MTVKVHHLLYAAVALALVLTLIARCGSDEGRIARQLDAIADLIAKDEGESALAGADRARRLGDSFTGDFVIALEPFGLEIRDRATLARQFAAYRHGTRSIEARWADRAIEIQAGGRAAVVTADVVLTARYGAGTGRERYRLRFELRRDGGGWKVHRLSLIEVVEGSRALLLTGGRIRPSR